MGDIYILDRRTGQPLSKVGEMKVPQGGVEPSQRAPTQMRSLYNTTQQPDITETQMWGLSPIDQMLCPHPIQVGALSGHIHAPQRR